MRNAMACRKCVLTFNLSIHPVLDPLQSFVRGPDAFMCQPCTFHGACWLLANLCSVKLRKSQRLQDPRHSRAGLISLHASPAGHLLAACC